MARVEAGQGGCYNNRSIGPFDWTEDDAAFL